MDCRMVERFKIPPNVHARRFDQATVVLNLAAGNYFSLDGVGTTIWDAAVVGKTLPEIVQQVLASYETDEATANADVRGFLDHLCAAGLLERG
jgi:hypothetical protein